MRTLLTRPRSTDALPGLTGAVREATDTDPALTELYQVALAAGRAVEETKLKLTVLNQSRAAGGDMLDQLADLREARITREMLAEHERDAAAAHAAWAEAVIVALRPTYREQIRRKAALLAQMGVLEKEHDELIASLNDCGVTGFSATLRPMSIAQGALRLDEPYSAGSLWLAEANSFELLD